MDGLGTGINTLNRAFNENLEPHVRKHLKNVYATFTLAGLSACAGAYVHMFSTLLQSGLLTALGAIGCMIALCMTPHNGKNQTTRLSLLGSFAFLSGINMGPLLQMAVIVDPSLIVTALLGTSIVFACFSIAAIVAPRGHYLYLGGTLLSAISTLFWLSIMNLFFGSRLLYQANLYIGLAVMCGFVVFDTQSIIEKSRNGDKDFVFHAMELFIDFVAMFKRLLIILTDKENQKNKKKRN